MIRQELEPAIEAAVRRASVGDLVHVPDLRAELGLLVQRIRLAGPIMEERFGADARAISDGVAADLHDEICRLGM